MTSLPGRPGCGGAPGRPASRPSGRHQRAEQTRSLSRTNRDLTHLRHDRSAVQRHEKLETQTMLYTAVTGLPQEDVAHATAVLRKRIKLQLPSDGIAATPDWRRLEVADFLHAHDSYGRLRYWYRGTLAWPPTH